MFEDQVCTRTKNYLVSIGNVFFFFGALQYTTLSPSTFVLTLFACETMNSCRKQFGKKESSFSTLDFVIWSGFCLNFSTLPEECLLAKPVAQLRVLAQECQYLLAISSFFLTFLLLLSLLLLLFLLLLFRYSSSCVALIHGGLFTKAAIICDKNFTRFPVFFGKYFQSFGESSEARPIFGSMVVNVDRLVKQKKTQPINNVENVIHRVHSSLSHRPLAVALMTPMCKSLGRVIYFLPPGAA